MDQQGKEMGWNDIKKMHVKDGKLFWDGKEVMTKQVVSLRWFELVLATTVAVSTVATAIWPIALHLGLFGLKAVGE
ncbi:hypothetical protein [Kaistia terrae]|uniref:Uncharacterized protein n=1 Tax=Kaistia terrae TaxID=537017 RepID=A0ABW0PYF9_9HYPH|nr:hypothetical protein [Kaistia terrae]MCX5579457.1 hypothetical protein [Kaistia terrae]